MALAGLCGAVIVMRVCFGPMDAPVSLHAPMNAEAGCALAVTLLLASHAISRREWTPVSVPRWWLAALGLGLLTAVAFWRGLHVYFVADDFVLVSRTNHLDFRSALKMFVWSFGFFRPLSDLTMAVSERWAAFSPELWHITSWMLHAVNALLVFLLALRLGLSRFAALFAAALFVVHGSRPEPVVWVAGRADLIATFFVLAALLFYLAARIPAALACMVIALLSKESAYMFPLLVVLLLFIRRDFSRRQMAVVALFGAVAGAVFLYRWSLLRGLGGYAGALGILTTAKALAWRMWAVLFFPINWSIEPSRFLAPLLAAYTVCLIWLAKSQTRRLALALPLGFVLVAALPPLSQLAIGPDLQKARLLYLPSVGFCLMLAMAVEALERRARWVVPGVILSFHLFVLQHNLTAWQRVGELARRACATAARCVAPSAAAAPASGVPGSIMGVYFLTVGFPECMEMQGCPGPGVEGRLTWDAAKSELRCTQK
jgi:hypothetical protein